MVMNKLNENVDESHFNHINAGRVDFFPKMAGHIDIVPVSTTTTTYTIPTDARWLIFSPASNFNYAIRKDEDAVFPAAEVLDGSGSLPNPAQIDVKGVTSLGIIADASGYLGIAVYG